MHVTAQNSTEIYRYLSCFEDPRHNQLFLLEQKDFEIEAFHWEMVWNENLLLKDVNTRLPQLSTGNWDKDTVFVLKLMREALKTQFRKCS